MALLKAPYFGLDELSDETALIRQIIAEFVGTLLLVVVGVGSTLGADGDIVRISLCFGLIVATLVAFLSQVCGCHINPAVTLGLATGGKIGMLRGLLLILFQCAGAIAGAFLLQALVPTTAKGVENLGTTLLANNVSLLQGFGIEMLITMVLVLTVFACAADEENCKSMKGSAALAIGLSITAAHLFAIPFTGAGMNPARSLGPALVTGKVSDLWVYWAGPLIGSIAAALLYQLVFQAAMQKKTSEISKQMKDMEKEVLKTE